MKLIPRVLALAAVISFSWCFDATAELVDFESLATGVSVNGQAGWTVEDEFGNSVNPFDEEVVDDGTGNNVFRISNSSAPTSFSDSPFSHSSPMVAGETGAALYNDRGPDFTSPLSPPLPGGLATTPHFYSSFDFKSATDGAQPGLQLSVSPSARQSSFRDSFLRIFDDGANGFDIFFYETGIEADPFGPTRNFPEVASDLAYDEWHTIESYITFVDGTQGSTVGNDIVNILVNGTLVYTGTTWESFYRGSNPAGLLSGTQIQAVDSLLFRPENQTPANAGGGLFFDNVVVSNDAFPGSTPVPEPASVALFGIGLVALVGITRRRRQAAKTE